MDKQKKNPKAPLPTESTAASTEKPAGPSNFAPLTGPPSTAALPPPSPSQEGKRDRVFEVGDMVGVCTRCTPPYEIKVATARDGRLYSACPHGGIHKTFDWH